MAANQTESSRLEQKSVITFLVIKKCKPREILRKMCDMSWEVCFGIKKNLLKLAEYRFATTSLS